MGSVTIDRSFGNKSQDAYDRFRLVPISEVFNTDGVSKVFINAQPFVKGRVNVFDMRYKGASLNFLFKKSKLPTGINITEVSGGWFKPPTYDITIDKSVFEHITFDYWENLTTSNKFTLTKNDGSTNNFIVSSNFEYRSPSANNTNSTIHFDKIKKTFKSGKFTISQDCFSDKEGVAGCSVTVMAGLDQVHTYKQSGGDAVSCKKYALKSMIPNLVLNYLSVSDPAKYNKYMTDQLNVRVVQTNEQLKNPIEFDLNSLFNKYGHQEVTVAMRVWDKEGALTKNEATFFANGNMTWK